MPRFCESSRALVTSTEPLLVLLLAAASAAAGLLFLAIARRVSKPAEIRRARKCVSGLLLEMWLYGDDPGQVLRTQFALAAANLRYAALMLPAAAAAAIPMILLWLALDPLLGRAPIPPGGTAIVTARGQPRESELIAPPGIRVETPALRLDTGEIQWRVRSDRETEGALRVTAPDGTGTGRRIVSSRGIRYLADWLEPVTIGYPQRTIRFAGIDLRWEWWFVLWSSVTALAFHRRFGVSL